MRSRDDPNFQRADQLAWKILDLINRPLDILKAVTAPAHPTLYKGLALFTPGGDLVYCIDPSKRGRWHHQLCALLQELLDLPEVPLFLTPCYTATLDCWFDAESQQLRIMAEAYPPVLRYQAILNAIFAIEDVVWESVPQSEAQCEPLVLQSYRQQFPQLWQSHNLVVRLDRQHPSAWRTLPGLDLKPNPVSAPIAETGYVLRLFVAGQTQMTEQILKNLHTQLAELLDQPYTLKVVDVLKQPELAEADHVAATPTLVKAAPAPMRRLVGDLNDPSKLQRLLTPPYWELNR